MAHLKVTIDGKLRLDSNPQWTGEPEHTAEKLVAELTAKTAQAWSIPVLHLIALYGGLRQQDATIDITTHPDGWTLEVSET